MTAKGRIAKAAGAISIATLISRILGYIKDMILARYFGATGTSDVFFVAFRIPNLLRELFAEGSMSSAFIPVLTEYRTRQGEEEANRLVRSTLLFILIFAGAVCVAGTVFAPTIVTAIAPGFVGDTPKFFQAVLLTRIMFPFLLFISLAAAVMGSLNTRGVFFVPALAPAMLNVVIIVCVVSLAGRFAEPIVAVAIGVTLGGLVQWLFQMPAFFRKGYRLSGNRPPGYTSREPDELTQPSGLTGMAESSRRLWHPGLRKIGLLVIPSTAGLAVAQVNIFVGTILASYLPEGSITYLYYSMRLIQFPIGVFGVAMGMAALPALSQHAARGELDKLKEDFSFSLRLLFFITVPAMAGLIALREPIVNTLFQRGRFDYIATIGTSEALMYYSLGIWAIVGVRLVTASFYSLQDTKTPVKVAVISVAVNIILSLLLMKPMRHSGLALATAAASSCNFVLLFIFLRKRMGGVGSRAIVSSFAKTAVASMVMGLAGWLLLRGDLWQMSGRVLLKATYLSVGIAVCLGVFLLLSHLLKSEELRYIIRAMRERRQRVT
ncbi:MAG TPA: murein biosynthesis integral membrane protein MurJ [Dissulfurispiraceae bacterium]|nr:murein biosynthesis integral membrane protein MurJ [Dissulfurispiraceae bacterium]